MPEFMEGDSGWLEIWNDDPDGLRDLVLRLQNDARNILERADEIEPEWRREARETGQPVEQAGEITRRNIWIKVGLDPEVATVLRNLARASKKCTLSRAASILLHVAISHAQVIDLLKEIDDREAGGRGMGSERYWHEKARALNKALN